MIAVAECLTEKGYGCEIGWSDEISKHSPPSRG